MLEHPKEYYNKILVDDSSFQGDQKKIYLTCMKRMNKNGNMPWTFVVSVSKEADNVEKKLAKPMNLGKQDGSCLNKSE